MSEPQAEERKLVKPEELVSGKRLEELYLLMSSGGGIPVTWGDFQEIGRAVLNAINITAVIPYTSGPCHCGFKKHPYDKCPDLERTGCPYITLPGCFFQDGAVLIRKPVSRQDDRGVRPNKQA